MGKDKLRRFAENLTFECFVQPAFEEAFRRDHPLKGHWHSDFFHNDRPIVLELHCMMPTSPPVRNINSSPLSCAL